MAADTESAVAALDVHAAPFPPRHQCVDVYTIVPCRKAQQECALRCRCIGCAYARACTNRLLARTSVEKDCRGLPPRVHRRPVVHPPSQGRMPPILCCDATARGRFRRGNGIAVARPSPLDLQTATGRCWPRVRVRSVAMPSVLRRQSGYWRRSAQKVATSLDDSL